MIFTVVNKNKKMHLLPLFLVETPEKTNATSWVHSRNFLYSSYQFSPFPMILYREISKSAGKNKDDRYNVHITICLSTWSSVANDLRFF